MTKGLCAYCGQVELLTDEHVIARSLAMPSSESLGVYPSKGRHPLGGRVVLKDVCARCNNESLSRLDSAAKHWIEAESASYHSLPSSSVLLRWCAKSAFNSERAEAANDGFHRPLPRGMPGWILHDGELNPGFGAVVTWVDPSHAAAGMHSFAELPNDPVLQGILHVGQWLFVLLWSYAGEPADLRARIQVAVDHFPGAEVGRSGLLPPNLVPRMRDPDWLMRGFFGSGVPQEFEKLIKRREGKSP